MKTKVITLALALFTYVTYAQYTIISDPNFEQALLDLSIDSEGTKDGQVLTSDISGVTSLDVHSYFISDLTGIEDFAALQSLNCRSNNLTTLNLYNNIALTHIECYANFISNLTLPNNNTLTFLNCGNNNLSSLDVSSYINLDYLACYNNSSNLNALDFTPNPALRELYCHNSGVTSLNISGCTLLEKLWCYGNSIGSLDISDSTGLIQLICYSNGLSNFTLSSGSDYNNLTYLDCGDNLIGSLDASKFPNIDTLYCYYNNLTSLDVSTNNLMVELDCGGNTALSSLTLPSVKNNLISLWAYDMNLTSLNYNEYTLLQDLDIGINNFTSADVSMLPDLFQFYCNQNQLTSLNIANGNIDNLAWMWCQNNPSGLCIQVDDLAKATAKSSPNWQRDPGSTFSLNCSLGLDQFNDESIAIFPNPSKSIFNVESNRNAKYTLTNVLGQEVTKGDLVNGINELETNSLVSGLYLLKIDSPEGSITKKLIKE